MLKNRFDVLLHLTYVCNYCVASYKKQAFLYAKAMLPNGERLSFRRTKHSF